MQEQDLDIQGCADQCYSTTKEKIDEPQYEG
jgi:hypothetical protein